MNSTAKGSSAELFVAEWLQDRSYVVGSRRHIGGAGDLTANHPNGDFKLVEVKGFPAKTSRSPYEAFRRPEREAMLQTPLPPGGSRWLAVVYGSAGCKSRRIDWISELSWPK